MTDADKTSQATSPASLQMRNQPVYTPRMEIVDALRGFALMGLFQAHATTFFELYWAHPEKKSLLHSLVYFAFEGKSFSLLALCFGLSFFIIMDRAARRGVDFSRRFAWRLGLLFVFGWLHGLIYMGEILQVLAPLGLLLIPLNRIKSNAVLIGLALLCFVQVPLLVQIYSALHGAAWANQPPHATSHAFYDVYMKGSLLDVVRLNAFFGQMTKWWYYAESGRMMQIVGLYITGLVLGRIGFFKTPEKFALPRWIVLLLTLGACGALYFYKSRLLAMVPQPDTHNMARYAAETLYDSLVNLSQMTVMLLIFMEVYLGFGRKLLGLLAPAGRMTLTLYIMQSLVFVPLYYGFGLGYGDDLTQMQALLLGLGFFGLQVVFAHLWFRFFLYGPLEWLWRSLTYLSLRVPFVRRSAPKPAKPAVP